MPNGIVLQLQAEALDETVDIETLLRKAYLVARKLHLRDFEEWILSEQNGYSSKIPEYRVVRGEIKALTLYSGWIPMVGKGEFTDLLSQLPLGNPISFIAELYRSDKGVAFSLGGELVDLLNEMSSLHTQYCFESSKTEMHRILSAVRNKVFEWSLMLEENGIIGENLQFKEKEIKHASESPIINSFTNNFYGSSNDTTINQGS